MAYLNAVLVNSTVTVETTCENAENVLQKLDWAEIMIKTAKERISKSKYPLRIKHLLFQFHHTYFKRNLQFYDLEIKCNFSEPSEEIRST